MKILIDTNIVLDLILERQPFVENAVLIFEQIELGNLAGYVAATTITNIFYIIRKLKGREVALAAIHRLLVGLQFCAVDRQTSEGDLLRIDNLRPKGFAKGSVILGLSPSQPFRILAFDPIARQLN